MKTANDNRIESTVTVNGKTVEYRNIKDRDCKRHGIAHPGRVEAGQHALVESGKRIVLWGVDRNRSANRFHPYRVEFRIGDTAVYGSYNLVYTGTITAIGPKTVTITDKFDGVTRLSIYDFNWRNNDFDADRISKHNHETMMVI